MTETKQPVVCNLCGESCEPDGLVIGDPEYRFAPLGLIDQKIQGGYESTPGNGYGALDDMTTYGFSLCEFCLDWLFTQFKLAPTVTYDTVSEPWRPAEQRVTEDEWRKEKEIFFKEFKKRNEARGHKEYVSQNSPIEGIHPNKLGRE